MNIFWNFHNFYDLIFYEAKAPQTKIKRTKRKRRKNERIKWSNETDTINGSTPATRTMRHRMTTVNRQPSICMVEIRKNNRIILLFGR